MSQVRVCDHCGQPITDDSTRAVVSFTVAQGGGGELDFHNSPQQACLYVVLGAARGEIKTPLPPLAVPPVA